MRLTSTKIDVVTRTAALPEDARTDRSVSRLTADGLHGPCRLQAYLCCVRDGATWTVYHYAYRLTGGVIRRGNAVRLKLVSDGAVVHVFDRPHDVVNDGRWYIHEHRTDVSASALTYARFEAWFEVPGLAGRVLGELRQPAPSGGTRDRDARARVRARAGNAQHVERATKRA